MRHSTPPRVYHGLKGVVVTDVHLPPGVPFDVEDCKDIAFVRCSASCSHVNFHAQNCTGICKLLDSNFADPLATDDDEAHNVQLDTCSGWLLSGLRLSDKTGSVSDHLNLWRSWSCKVSGVAISGMGNATGSGVCVDGPDGGGHKITLCKLDRCGQVGFAIAGGDNITVIGNWIFDCQQQAKFPDAGNVPIAVFSAYARQRKHPMSGIHLLGNTMWSGNGNHSPWVTDDGSVSGLEQAGNICGDAALPELRKAGLAGE